MILTAHQPSFLMWLGTLAKIAQADVYVSFDDVQYERRGFTNRNYIKTANGPLLLTVPVASKNHFQKHICEIEIMPGNWVRKHLRSIELAYRKAPYFEEHYASISAILKPYNAGGLLADLNETLLRYFLAALGIYRQLLKASHFKFVGTGSDLVLNMCLQLKANSYIFGGEGANYAKVGAFREAGVEPIFQQFQHPVYVQQHGAFLPNMCVLDLLMNAGPDSLRILTGKQA